MKATRLVPLAAGALTLGMLGAWAPAHADTDQGYVTGKVTDSSGRPLAGAQLTIYWCDTVDDGGAADADGCYDTEDEGYGLSDRSGSYLAAIPNNSIAERTGATGNWRIRAARTGFTTATSPVTAAPRTNTAGPTLALTAAEAAPATPPANTALTGVVTDAAGVPVTGAEVTAFDSVGRSVQSTTTYADGRYYFVVGDPAGVPVNEYADDNVTGSVRLRVTAPGHVIEWSGDTTVKSKATPVPVAAYGAATPAAAPATALAALGTITGTVKLPAAGANWAAFVRLVDLDGNYLNAGGTTDSTGNFSFDVDPGTYYLRADGGRFTEVPSNEASCPTCVERGDEFGFVGGYYGGGTSLATAKRITVKSGASKAAGTITLTNALKAVEKPKVTGKLVKGKLVTGKKLKVTKGVWNRQADTTYSYVWKVGNKTLGKKATLPITKKVIKKIGKNLAKVTVTVMATDRNAELVDGKAKVKVKKALTSKTKG